MKENTPKKLPCGGKSRRHKAAAARHTRWLFGIVCALAVAGASWVSIFFSTPNTAHASLEAEPDVASIEVFPADVHLRTKRDSQTLVVRATDPRGLQRDVTARSTFAVADLGKAHVENAVLTPLQNGITSLVVSFGSHQVSVPIEITEAQAEPPISFRREIMPIFLRGGCNAGGCHGSARGQDGFRLSLFGYDPEGDYFRLTREMAGRRINLALPAESMVLTKTTGGAPHTGGKLFEPESDPAQTLQRWLKEGAADDGGGVPACTSVELLPRQLFMEGPGETHRLTVRAHYADGSLRDVTKLALFLTNNESSAKISKEGIITTGQRGEAFVMARFATHTVGAQVIVIPKGLQFTWPEIPEKNFIDHLVDEKLRHLRITPSELCDDETFLRRASIDITGTLPTSVEVSAFLLDRDPEKRAKKIDVWLARPEFVEIWALKWSELLQVRTEPNSGGYKSTLTYYRWIREQLEKNVPINEIARQLISAKGGTLTNPAANFYQGETEPLKLAEDTAQAFLGIRVQCAQCHNHPFDRWTMDDYRGFMAFFTQVGRKPGEDPRERIIFNRAEGEARHPVGDRVVLPKFLGGAAPETKGKDRREVLAEWLAAPENPYFARHMANLIWAQYLGRGIIEPVDDGRISNPASNPELLDALAKELVEHQYDIRHLVRQICNSRTYQTSTRGNETNATDQRNFAHATIRRMRAEVLLDCISEVTGTKDKFQGLPLGARAAEIADGKTSTYFLTTFGRSTRETICSREEVGPTLSQALHLLNGDTVEQKIVQGDLIKKWLAEKKTAPEIVTELYLRCFGRKPEETELQQLNSVLVGPPEKQSEALRDIFWAMLNAKEFLFNH